MRAKNEGETFEFRFLFLLLFFFCLLFFFRPDFVFVHFQIVQIQHEAGRRFGNVVMCFCHLLLPHLRVSFIFFILQSTLSLRQHI